MQYDTVTNAGKLDRGEHGIVGIGEGWGTVKKFNKKDTLLRG